MNIPFSIRRTLVVGALGLLASGTTFLVGARLGMALNGQVGSISVAKIPLRALQSASLPR